MDVQESTPTLTDCPDLHDAAYRCLDDAGKRTAETKRKAHDAHDQMVGKRTAHRDRCRQATAEFVTAEEDLNDCQGRRGQLVKDSGRQHTRCHEASKIVTAMKFAIHRKLSI